MKFPSSLPAARLAILCLALTGISAAADPADSRAAKPMAAGAIHPRTIKTFDFDEEQLGNFEPGPMHWRPVSARGFPPFQRALLDKQVGHASPPSMRLSASVGSVGAVYTAGDISIDPECDYRVTAWVRTERLFRAAAFLRAAMLDAAGEPIAGSSFETSPLRTADTRDAWTKVELVLPGRSPNARAIQLSVLVNQPDSSLPSPSIRHEDTYCGAWFDDIEVSRLPRVRFTARTDAVIVSDESPQLDIAIRDPDPADLAAELSVFDASGRRVIASPLKMPNSSVCNWEISTGPLAAGWYRAVVTVSSAGMPLCSAERIFIRDAISAMPISNGNSFVGLNLPSAGQVRIHDFESLVAWLAPGAVSLQLTPDRGRESILAHWRGEGRTIVSRLTQADTSTLTDVIMRYGSVVDAWQLVGVRDDAVAGICSLIRRAAGPAPIISTRDVLTEPTSSATARAGLSISVPDRVPTARILPQVAHFTRHSGPTVWVELAAPRSVEPAAIADWSKRILLARQAGAQRVFVPAPWRIDNATESPRPEPSALALRAISTLIADRAPIQMLDRDDGVHTALFAIAGAESGTLVAWADDAGTEPKKLTLPLGTGIRAFDFEGRPLANPATAGGIRLGESPIYLVGVHVRELLFAGALTIDGPPLEVGRESQSRTLRFRNPTPRPLNATLKLAAPSGWSVSPKSIRLAIAATGSGAAPVEFRLPRNAPAGITDIPVEVSFDDGSAPVTLVAPASVGLADLDVRVLWRVESGRLVIQQLVTNRAAGPVSLRAVVRSPNHPRETRTIENLDPGRTAIREFVLDNAAALLDRSVRVTLARAGGSELANHIIRLESPAGLGHER